MNRDNTNSQQFANANKESRGISPSRITYLNSRGASNALGDFNCKICFKLAYNPVNCSICQSIYCKYCAEAHHMENRNTSLCLDKCRGAKMDVVEKESIKPYEAEIRVACKFRDQGCKQVCLYSELAEHQEKCNFSSNQREARNSGAEPHGDLQRARPSNEKRIEELENIVFLLVEENKRKEYLIQQLIKQLSLNVHTPLNLEIPPALSINNDGIYRGQNFESDKVDGVRPLYTLSGHDKTIYTLCRLDTNTFASGGFDTKIVLWNSLERKEINHWSAHTKNVTCLLKLKSGELVSGSWDSNIKIWPQDGRGGYKSHTNIVLKKHTKTVYVLVELKNDYLLSCSYDGTLLKWKLDADKNYPVEEIKDDDEKGHSGAIKAMIKLDDSGLTPEKALKKGEESKMDERVATAGADGLIIIWAINRSALDRRLEGHTGELNCLAQLEGTSYHYMASGGKDGIIVWDLTKMKKVHQISYSTEVFCLAALKDGTFASGSSDGIVKIWNINSKEPIKSFPDHEGAVRCLLLKEDELVSAAADGLIKVWKLDIDKCK